jgi:hypothetical protein
MYYLIMACNYSSLTILLIGPEIIGGLDVKVYQKAWGL